jgi:hypothetical protein
MPNITASASLGNIDQVPKAAATMMINPITKYNFLLDFDFETLMYASVSSGKSTSLPHNRILRQPNKDIPVEM